MAKLLSSPLRLADLQGPEGNERLADGFLKLQTGAAKALANGLTVEENFAGQWHTTQGIYVPERWVVSSLYNSWKTFSLAPYSILAPGYRIGYDGFAEFRGLLEGGTIATGLSTSSILSAPKPARSEWPLFPVRCSGTTGEVRVMPLTASTTRPDLVGSDGWCLHGISGNNTYLSVTGIRYEVEDKTPTPAGCWPYHFAIDERVGKKPRAVMLAGVLEKDTGARPGLVGLPSWDLVSRDGRPHVRINDVPGLVPLKTYFLTFLVLGA